MVATAQVPAGPGYQTPFAAEIRKVAKIPTGAVGMITSAHQAEHILRTGQADVVLLAREFLRDPYFPLHAASQLGIAASWPVQYLRAADRGATARQALPPNDPE
jgi:2,4-dienoyl-CoA reductase-like NADH-dependent reductase (Old Yellow Enzyme family)